jgi:hypothetical protein
VTRRRPRLAHGPCAAVVAVAIAAMLLSPAAAGAATTLRCKSADLRYAFRPGGPKTFGVFRLRITGGTCRTAHRVAKDWMAKFEARIRAGNAKPPRLVDGFAFTTLPPTAAQTFSERGRRRTTTIRFDYRVPNG